MNRVPTLRAWGAAAFEQAFARRMLRLRKTVELNAASCSNAPAGPPIQVVGAAGPVDKSTGLKPGPRKGTPKREGVNWLPLSTQDPPPRPRLGDELRRRSMVGVRRIEAEVEASRERVRMLAERRLGTAEYCVDVV